MKTLHMSEAIAVFNALKHEKISERVANENLGPMGATNIQVWTSVLGGTLQMETANGGCTLVIKPCSAAMLQGAAGNSPAIPDGYALVPVEPTREMVRAALFKNTNNAVWKAMLAAAPQQEAKA